MAYLQTETDDVSITDNRVLDQWRIPFGDWYDQAVDWIANEFGDQLNGVEEAFGVLIDFVNDTILLGPPWFVIVFIFFMLGWLLQNIKVGVFAAVALTVCGLMGTNYWDQTAKTIGYIFVAVLLCSLIGIPIGIACGRVDAFWRAVRPMLDAMQVVHSFVYMLPIIYFFGIGPVSATIVTMVFALPPLIRLTNLGIRQVPEDVVEASRAFGQTERAILRDVQLPLARPAIMTGINQTLLLSISMLGIAALMGAGGLARFMFQALNNQDPALSGSAGLAFFLVAVVLDRLTQRDGDSSKSLAHRLNLAWSNRKTPEELLVADTAELDLPETASSVVNYEPVTARERTGIMVAIGGSVLTVVSLFLTWNSDGGWFSSFSRRLDEVGSRAAQGVDEAASIDGDSFNGLQASGGSWFGYMLIALAAFVILASIAVLRNPGYTNRWLNADGAVAASLAALVVAITYVLSSPSENAVASSGIGSIIALIGAVIMTAGAVMWIMDARHEPLRPLPTRGMVAPVIVAGLGVLMLLGSGFSNWSHDERTEVVISAELQAQLDELEAEARDPETEQRRSLAIINEMTSLRASAVNTGAITISGFSGNGSTAGWWTLLAGLGGLATTTLAAGFVFADARKQWIAGALTLGLGAGILAVALGWIGTLARATDQNVVSGVGVFFALVAGATIANAGRSIINDFRRSRIYPEITDVVLDKILDDGESAAGDREVVGAAIN